MTKAEHIERYGLEWYEEYIARKIEQHKNDVAYSEYQKEYQKEYRKKDLTNDGKLKNNIRFQSNYILFKQRRHTKLKDYQIHHCFGYEDPSKFIYIPKTLHKAIHRFLKDNNINADTDHYKYISTMINECTEYTYISA